LDLVRLEQIIVDGEVHGPLNENISQFMGKFYWYDVLDGLPRLIDQYENKIQLVYMDPPFVTGQLFKFQQPMGAEGWKGNRKYLITHTAYNDIWKSGRKAFLSLMKNVLNCVHRLLSPEGSLYLHIDYRTSPYVRILLDEIFGEDNFLNEIIWHYRSGGRAKNHFSRKHDTILFYTKSSQYYFDLESVGIPRGKDKRNHMKQQVDEDGRIFWSIKSGGKEYRYYEDSKVYPSDVWDDIPHLHQRNPERSGYDTQKPEALLERIIKASSRPGDIVADFFVGSGTTLAAAQKLGRKWIGMDNGVFALHTCRRRLVEGNDHLAFRFHYGIESQCQMCPRVELDCIELTNEQLEIRLLKYTAYGKDDGSLKDLSLGRFDVVDYWAAGYIEGGTFKALNYSMRTANSPHLNESLRIDRRDNIKPAVHIVDIYGEQWFYQLK
jgi:site-specific DNA-methyltransferase (adenine-specific)